MKKVKYIIFLLVCVFAVSLSAVNRISLDGEWAFAVGDTCRFTGDKILLPGSMVTRGKGDAVTDKTIWTGSTYDSTYYFSPAMAPFREKGNIKYPFFLTPGTHYVGNAWYERDVFIPAGYAGKSVLLHLERPHIESQLWVNGVLVGADSSLVAPHIYDISDVMRPGYNNTLRVRVYNGVDNVCVGPDSHSVTDQTQGNWNGIAGYMYLEARPKQHVADMQIFPDVATKSIKVCMEFSQDLSGKQVTLVCSKYGNKETICSKKYAVKGSYGEVNIKLGDKAALWSEFSPNLYTLSASVDGDTVTSVFGLREISIKGRQFYVNGNPVWMRGTVESCLWPDTGYAPTDVDSWLKVFKKCKEFGLNMIRFHSYCPPEAAFTAADLVGIYLQPEGPSWPNHGIKLGNGMAIDRYLLDETKRMVRKYGNHPSFCMLAAGNEPAGNWVEWCGDFVDYWKSTGDTRRVYCGASVGGGWAFEPRSQYHVRGRARGLNWNKRAPQSIDDFYNDITRIEQRGKSGVKKFDINEPFLSHEQGQWCVFPDLKEIDRYKGAYKAGNFEIFKSLLEQGGMAHLSEKFLEASGKLQTLAYKYEIERNLRTPDYAGFQLLALNDYSGQGSALVGVLNVFWEEKGYCTSKEWRNFCAPVVPLAKFPKFIYADGDTVAVDFELYNASESALPNASVKYVMNTDGKNILEETYRLGQVPLGKNIVMPSVAKKITVSEAPLKVTLTATVSSNNKEVGENCWEFWVYPDAGVLPVPDDILVADCFDKQVLDRLSAGGKVLLTVAGKVKYGNDVVQRYLPVFWNTSWFKMRPPHTTGALIHKEHPLFDRFQSDTWANLNWWELVNNAQVMNLANFPRTYQSPVQPIDTWHLCRKLGMVVEAEVNGGKLFMTSMDINTKLDKRHVARHMRNAILKYMSSGDFKPEMKVDTSVIVQILNEEAPKIDMFTNESPDELKPQIK
ncbi:sugar-binding domain-containing protein [Muribaculum sp.]|jgi:hypothetical protein|uniref:sugar-binding domain-containing protein n=2 Tax=Muribaculum TaxID=1918540 RepID=UPI002580B2AD|nr:sugar-binding domain-containing protein [Muribaculum sp.]